MFREDWIYRRPENLNLNLAGTKMKIMEEFVTGRSGLLLNTESEVTSLDWKERLKSQYESESAAASESDLDRLKLKDLDLQYHTFRVSASRSVKGSRIGSVSGVSFLGNPFSLWQRLERVFEVIRRYY